MKQIKQINFKALWLVLAIMILIATGFATPVHAAKNQVGTFGKFGPDNGSIISSTNITLTWENRTDALSYTWCIMLEGGDTCAYTGDVSGDVSETTVDGLTPNTTYYWQIKATGLFSNDTIEADNYTWWSFTTLDENWPGAFGKIAPADQALDQPTDLTLTWNASDRASSYEYCLATWPNINSCDSWTPIGHATELTLSDLNPFTIYYWQVRAVNAYGSLEADNQVSWGFRTLADIWPPFVNSITRADANPSHASSVNYYVNFSEPVTGVDVTDFQIVRGATSPYYGETVSSVSGSGASYVVTVNTGSMQMGEFRLDLVNNNSIKDRGNNAPVISGFTGEYYLIDKIAPYVDIRLADAIYGYPYHNPTDEAIVTFVVQFSEPVIGVDVSDFALAKTGNINGESILDVSGTSGNYLVRVNTGYGNGELRLTVMDDDSIVDQALNPLFGVGTYNYISTRYYTIEKVPQVISVICSSETNPTFQQQSAFLVEFSDNVTGVDVSDFSIEATGGAITGYSISSVSPDVGPMHLYSIAVDNGSYDGILRLTVLNDGSIQNLGGTPLAHGYEGSAGECYVIKPPAVMSVTRANPNPTDAASVDFTVTFSRPVTGVDATDFNLARTGSITDYGVTGVSPVSGPSDTYTVTVNTGEYNGSLRLDVVNDGSIQDQAGVPMADDFTNGEVYAITKNYSMIYLSQAAYDGYVLESSETSGIGGTKNYKSKELFIGDDVANKQYRSILSFNTSGIPANAQITKVTLRVKRSGVVGGGNPINTFRGFLVDIKQGNFGTAFLALGDFKATADKTYGPFKPALSGGWYSIDLTSGQGYINRASNTQMRLRFKLDDNNNSVANYLKLYSGNAGATSSPQLIVEYYVP